MILYRRKFRIMTKNKKHRDSLRRIKEKWGHIRDCRRLVEWHLEYQAEDEKKRQESKKRLRYFYKLKYKRLDRNMLSLFPDNVMSEHNRWVLQHFGFMWCKNRR